MSIVPRTPLLWVAVLAALPLLTLAGQENFAAAAWLGLLALLVLAMVDASVARRRLRGLQAGLKPVERLAIDRQGEIELRIENPSLKLRRLRMGLALPKEFDSPEETLDALLPAGQPRSRFVWHTTPEQRGVFKLDAVHVELASPLGWFAARAALPAQGEIHVYPNLSAERRRNPALFLNRGGLGVHRRRQVGKGRDFEKLREFIPGDDIQDIHWKATAKRGTPVTKLFQVERTQEVYVVIDTSRLSARRPPREGDDAGQLPHGEASVLERFITAALMLGVAAQRQGDNFGLITFSDRVHSFVRAKNGKAHYQSLLNALYALQPRRVNPAYDELFTFIRLRLRRRALLVILTDIDDPLLSESFRRNLELVRRQHLVLVNMLRPLGAQPLFSHPAENQAGLYEQFAGHISWRRLLELQKALQRQGVALGLLDNEKLAASLVSQYLTVKGRQSL